MFRDILLGVICTLTFLSAPLVAAAGDNDMDLLPEQIALLKSTFPGWIPLRVCTGHLGGLSTHDAVVGLILDNGSLPVGVIWDGFKWTTHRIDKEIDQDSSTPSLGFWDIGFTEDSRGDFRCNFQPGQDAYSSTAMDKPFFDLKKFGLEKNTVVCLATIGYSDKHTNWDCVVYSPVDKHFKFWLRQPRKLQAR